MANPLTNGYYLARQQGEYELVLVSGLPDTPIVQRIADPVSYDLKSWEFQHKLPTLRTSVRKSTSANRHHKFIRIRSKAK